MIVKMYYILILISKCLLLICRNVIDFCILILYPASLWNSLILSRSFIGIFLGIFYNNIYINFK